jgi:CP family cyanate transporter-like MFS transporter
MPDDGDRLTDAEANSLPRPPPTLARSGVWLLGASLVLIAFNLRAAVSSIGPVLRDIIAHAGLSATGASVLTTLPSLCFGLAALAATGLARHLGPERAVLAGLAALTGGLALRGTTGLTGLFAGQVLATAGIGVINVLLPGLVKRDFSHRVALMTGLYTMAFCAGAAGAAGATVPLALVLGGWGGGLAIWALPAGLAALVWAFQVPRGTRVQAHAGSAVRGLWSDRLAWQVTLFMGLQSALAYLVFGWLAPILRDRGLSAVDAGLVLSVSVVAQAVASLVAPALATRGASQSFANVLSVALCMVGLMGCMFAPLGTVWLWAVVLGLAQGALIAIALTVIVLRAPDPHVAAHLSGMAQSVGYLLASAGPLLAGLLHGWTGGWGAVAAFSLAIGAAAALFGYGAGRPRHVGAVSARLGGPPNR